MDGYYDYQPTISLQRPVALTGFFGAGVATAAGVVSQRTGLFVADLDRWISHDRGCSLGELVLREGERALREAEERLLPRAISTRPSAVIALGDGALLRRKNRRRIEKETELIYLRASLDTSMAGIARELETGRANLYPFIASVPENPEDLAPLLQERALGYERARYVIDVDGRSAWDVSEEILSIIKRAGSA